MKRNDVDSVDSRTSQRKNMKTSVDVEDYHCVEVMVRHHSPKNQREAFTKAFDECKIVQYKLAGLSKPAIKCTGLKAISIIRTH
jgi:hypothetical protein